MADNDHDGIEDPLPAEALAEQPADGEILEVTDEIPGGHHPDQEIHEVTQ